jgi:hypothetical protein
VKGRILPLLFCAVLMTLAGCTTTETVLIDLKAPAPDEAVKAGKPDALRVIVLPIEDQRPDKSRLGIRTHYWTGSVTYFKGAGGRPIDLVTQFVADYLTLKGWQAKVGTRAAASSEKADVILSSKLLDGDGDATSTLGKTDIVVKGRFAVEALNTADGSTVRINLNGDGTQRVFWFDEDDMRDLIRDVLAKTLDQFLAATKVANRRLQ